MGKKTRPFAGPQDWRCPIHGDPVKRKARFRTDKETGQSRYGGEFFACPHYGNCGYYVSPGDGSRPPVVAVVTKEPV